MEINKDNVFLIRKYICHGLCSTDSVASNMSLGAGQMVFVSMAFLFVCLFVSGVA